MCHFQKFEIIVFFYSTFKKWPLAYVERYMYDPFLIPLVDVGTFS